MIGLSKMFQPETFSLVDQNQRFFQSDLLLLSVLSTPAMEGQGRAGGQGRAPAVPRLQSPLDAALGQGLCAKPSPSGLVLTARSSWEMVHLEQAYSFSHRRPWISPLSFLSFPKPLLGPWLGSCLLDPSPLQGQETRVTSSS